MNCMFEVGVLMLVEGLIVVVKVDALVVGVGDMSNRR